MLRYLLLLLVIVIFVTLDESNSIIENTSEPSIGLNSTEDSQLITINATTIESSTTTTTTTTTPLIDVEDPSLDQNIENPYDYTIYDSLIHKLFDNYTKDVSPMIMRNGTDQMLNYSLSIQNFKLLEVNDVNGMITIATDMYQIWNDTRLKWDREDYDNITGIISRQDKVWSPPFTTYEGSEVKDLRDNEFRSVYITNDGVVKTLVSLQVSTTCMMNTADFPFDVQKCDFTFGLAPVADSLFLMRFTNTSVFRTDLCTMSNSAWKIFYVDTMIHPTQTDIMGMKNIKNAKIRITMSRRAGFYMVMIVAPIFIINGMSLVGVFMKSKHGNIQRLTIGLTHVMTMTFILSMLGEQLPRAENISLLGKFIIASLCGMIFATILSTKKNRILNFFGFESEYLRGHSSGDLKKSTSNSNKTRSVRIRTVTMMIFLFLNLLAASYMVVQYAIFNSKTWMDVKKCTRKEIAGSNLTADDFKSVYFNETEMEKRITLESLSRGGEFNFLKTQTSTTQPPNATETPTTQLPNATETSTTQPPNATETSTTQLPNVTNTKSY